MIRKKYVNFKTRHEDSSVYKISDGTILKARFILIKVLDEGIYDEIGNPVYGINSNNVVSIFIPDNLWGNPSKQLYSRKELEDTIIEEDMAFDKIKEGWNTYELDNGAIISIKLVLASISRTNKFNQKGEPIYLYNVQLITKSKMPDKLRKKPE